jgi:hypothetical protein
MLKTVAEQIEAAARERQTEKPGPGCRAVLSRLERMTKTYGGNDDSFAPRPPASLQEAAAVVLTHG